jgi:uncharacterized protein with ATP-grasp and redox domains
MAKLDRAVTVINQGAALVIDVLTDPDCEMARVCIETSDGKVGKCIDEGNYWDFEHGGPNGLITVLQAMCDAAGKHCEVREVKKPYATW